jgi:hypothetical protein
MAFFVEGTMECKRCKDTISDGDAFRAEPIVPGSRHYVAYHVECYARLKQERQALPDYPDRETLRQIANEDS